MLALSKTPSTHAGNLTPNVLVSVLPICQQIPKKLKKIKNTNELVILLIN
jgi:hypothetical protein